MYSKSFPLLLVCVLSCLLFTSSNPKPSGFSSRIINRNSVRSPFHKPNLSRSDRISASIDRSLARHNYLQMLMSNKISQASIEAPTTPVDGEYVMEYYIGTPPVRTYGILDTGSSTTWLQCLPCKNCYHQSKAILFDPSKSSSYNPLLCKDTRCVNIYNSACTDDYHCRYHVQYSDASYTNGDIAEETLIFHDGIQNTTLEKIVIGCGHNNSLSIPGEGFPGLIGLINRYESIVEQLSLSKFSYCFGDFDEIDAHGLAKFGDVAETYGQKTPFFFHDLIYPFYFLTLENIRVEKSLLSIHNDTFSIKEDRPSGFVIDSGTQYTYLNTTAYKMLINELKQKMHGYKSAIDKKHRFTLCYEINFLKYKSVPVVSLLFTGVDLQLPVMNTWINTDGDVHCLAMYPTDGSSILGNYQQQNYNIRYDLKNKVVSFNYKICGGDD